MEILTLQGLSKFYTAPQSVVVGLNNVSLSFRLGEFVAITGESGSGKSTLAQVLGGILPFEGGELYLKGKPTSHFDASDWERYRRSNISFISQSYGILAGCSVLSNVVSALRLSGMPKKQAKQEAEAILKRVSLWELRKRRAAKLSSGQKQRLSVARALAKPAPIVLADEPTGNLDSENSAKIIQLLREAAKERLVILITHDFEEAADHATRRIHLHDGSVVMDTALRAPNEVTQAPVTPTNDKRGLSCFVALLQLKARPVWSTMLLCFFVLTAFGVFAFLGTFLVSVDDTSTRIYDNSAFRNGDKERLVVVRTDGQNMTDADMEALLQLAYVERIERFGYAADINYSYRKDVDFRFYYSAEDAYVFFTNTALYVQTEPLFANGRDYLCAGRHPETMYEVVAVGDDSLLGQTIPIYIQDRKNWADIHYIYFEAEIVGVTDYGSGLYFHEDMGAVCTSIAYADESKTVYLPAYDEEIKGSYRCTEQRYLSKGARALHFVALDCFVTGEVPTREDYFSLPCAGSHASTCSYVYELDAQMFQTLCMQGYPTQISIYMEDYAYTDRVLEEIRALGYAALSPFREGSTEQDPELAQQRMQTLKICLLALAAVFLLQIFVLRAMYSAQMENYRLLSNIGLRCTTAKTSILLQLALFAVPAQILAWLGIVLCGRVGVSQIENLLRYMTLSKFALLSAVHLCACAISAFWIMHAIRKQVYPFVPVTADLDMEVEA